MVVIYLVYYTNFILKRMVYMGGRHIHKKYQVGSVWNDWKGFVKEERG